MYTGTSIHNTGSFIFLIARSALVITCYDKKGWTSRQIKIINVAKSQTALFAIIFFNYRGGDISESFLAKKFGNMGNFRKYGAPLFYWGPITGIILAKKFGNIGPELLGPPCTLFSS